MGSLSSEFLIRDSAQNGARRLTDDPGGPGNRPPFWSPPLGVHRRAAEHADRQASGLGPPAVALAGVLHGSHSDRRGEQLDDNRLGHALAASGDSNAVIGADVVPDR